MDESGGPGVPANHMLTGADPLGRPRTRAELLSLPSSEGSRSEFWGRAASPALRVTDHASQSERQSFPSDPAQGRRRLWVGHRLVFLTGWEAGPTFPREDGTQDKLVPAMNSLQINRTKHIMSGSHRYSSACTYSVPARTQ